MVVNCARCGMELPRADVRFCTRCGAPVGQASAGQPPIPQAPQPPPPGYGDPYDNQAYEHRWGPQPPYDRPPERRSSPLVPVLVGAALILVLLGGVAYWAMTQMDNPPLPVGRASTATPVPTATPLPTSTPQPGLGINIPGPQGTPTTISIPLPIPGLGAQPGSSPGLPTIVLPTISIPGASGTPPPNAKLTADQAREKVKESLSNCQLLQAQINLSQVTFEAPTWHVRLPISGATWNVDDNSGAVTPDERAADRARNCRL